MITAADRAAVRRRAVVLRRLVVAREPRNQARTLDRVAPRLRRGASNRRKPRSTPDCFHSRKAHDRRALCRALQVRVQTETRTKRDARKTSATLAVHASGPQRSARRV